jgi:Histidine kinase-, DNA gyrase B-, and HSP90-like ATPase
MSSAWRANHVIASTLIRPLRFSLMCRGVSTAHALPRSYDHWSLVFQRSKSGCEPRPARASATPSANVGCAMMAGIVVKLVGTWLTGLILLKLTKRASRGGETGKTASGDVLVAVRDSGPGLALAALERVFDPFYTSKPGGLGMGLSICRSIIEAHGGRLWVSANVTRGATFQFTVRVASPSIRAISLFPTRGSRMRIFRRILGTSKNSCFSRPVRI